MNLLALDTSGDACSVAALTGEACFSRFVVEPRAHARLILPMIDEVLLESGLVLNSMDALAFGRGPGAFTGLRIAAGVVQGLALAADKPVIPVSTLATVAQQVHEEHQASKVLVAMDARMGEVYWGQFVLQDGEMCLQGEEQVIPPSVAPVPDEGDWVAAGSGWRAYQRELDAASGDKVMCDYPDVLPRAEYLAKLAEKAWRRGEAVMADQAQPVYLRNKVAETVKERALKA